MTLRLESDLSTSENDRVISPFGEGFIFANFAPAKFHENKTLAKIYEFTVFKISCLPFQV